MQAITTTFLGPTDHCDARYKATCEAATLTLSSDHRLDSMQNHERVARALIVKLGWFHDETRGDRYGRWYSGGVKGAGYVFVCGVEYAELKPDGVV